MVDLPNDGAVHGHARSHNTMSEHQQVHMGDTCTNTGVTCGVCESLCMNTDSSLLHKRDVDLGGAVMGDTDTYR